MTAPAITARPDGPAARLRAASMPIHRATEDEPFITTLLAGGRSIADYTALLGQLRPVYAALEAATAASRSTAPDDVAALFDPALDRLATIDHDLGTLGSSAEAHAPLPETATYVARIATIRDDPPRLLAHHYVRYLGDLSGGQVVAAMLRRHYGLGDDALTFYAFTGLGAKGAVKTRYRELLDRILAPVATFDAVLDETLRAYEANRALFAALGRSGA